MICDAAVEELRKKGAAKADQKSGRVAAERCCGALLIRRGRGAAQCWSKSTARPIFVRQGREFHPLLQMPSPRPVIEVCTG